MSRTIVCDITGKASPAFKIKIDTFEVPILPKLWGLIFHGLWSLTGAPRARQPAAMVKWRRYSLKTISLSTRSDTCELLQARNGYRGEADQGFKPFIMFPLTALRSVQFIKSDTLGVSSSSLGIKVTNEIVKTVGKSPQFSRS